MADLVHIEQIADTISNVASNADEYQVGIYSENITQGYPSFWWEDGSNNVYSAACIGQDASFVELTVTDDVLIDEYIKLSSATDNYIRMQDNDVDIVANGSQVIQFDDSGAVLSIIGAAGAGYTDDKILVGDSGRIKYLTSAQLAADLTFSGTENYVQKLDDLGNMVNSSIIDNGVTVALNGTNFGLNTNYISYDGSDEGLNLDASNNATFSEALTATGALYATNKIYGGSGATDELILSPNSTDDTTYAYIQITDGASGYIVNGANVALIGNSLTYSGADGEGLSIGSNGNIQIGSNYIGYDSTSNEGISVADNGLVTISSWSSTNDEPISNLTLNSYVTSTGVGSGGFGASINFDVETQYSSGDVEKAGRIYSYLLSSTHESYIYIDRTSNGTDYISAAKFGDNVELYLGGSAGSENFYIKDSSGTICFSVNSDGRVDLVSDLYINSNTITGDGTGGLSIDGNGNVNIDGQVRFDGVHSCLYADDNSTAQSISDSTWTKLTAFDSAINQNNAVGNGTANSITFSYTGYYLVICHINCEVDTAAVSMNAAIYYDGTIQNQTKCETYFANSNQVGNATLVGIVDVTSGSTAVDVRVYHEKGSSVNVTPVNISLSATYIGAT